VRLLTLVSLEAKKSSTSFNCASVQLRSHPAGIEGRWNWLKSNWDELYKRLPPGLGMLGYPACRDREEDACKVHPSWTSASSSGPQYQPGGCLGASEDPELIKRTLGLAMSEEVKSQDIYMPLGGVQKLAVVSWTTVPSMPRPGGRRL
jgi:hypothetical protein